MDDISLRERIRSAVAKAFYTSKHTDFVEAAQTLIKKLCLGERWVEYAHIEFLNKLNEKRFKKVPLKLREA